MISEKDKNKYINNVSSELKCSHAAKKEILEQIDLAIDEVSEDADMDYYDIIRILGAERQAAENYTAAFGDENYKKRKTRLKIVFTAVVAIIIAILIIVIVRLADKKNSYEVIFPNGYGYEDLPTKDNGETYIVLG